MKIQLKQFVYYIYSKEFAIFPSNFNSVVANTKKRNEVLILKEKLKRKAHTKIAQLVPTWRVLGFCQHTITDTKKLKKQFLANA